MRKPPKEKAINIVNEFTMKLFDTGAVINKNSVKECALFHVSEMLIELNYEGSDEVFKYYKNVKEEIQNL